MHTMAFNALDEPEDDLNPEINTTPLVDVMLVLLIVFMITIPVMSHSVKLDLPRARNEPNRVMPKTVNLAVDEHGRVFWDSDAIDEPQLKARIAQAAAQTPQPEIHLRGARTVPYEKVARVMAAAQAGGLEKIGFVLDPGSH